MMDNVWDHSKASSPSKGPIERQHEGILLQAVLPEYKGTRREHIEMWDFALADIRRMIAAIYANSPSCRSIASTGIVGLGAAIQTMDQGLSKFRCNNYSMLDHYRRNCPNRCKQHHQ